MGAQRRLPTGSDEMASPPCMRSGEFSEHTGAVQVTVPGKLILAGEHAAVYGRPALIAAVDLWLRVRITRRSEPGVVIELPAMSYHGAESWASIRSYAQAARERWQHYIEAGPAASFAEVRREDPAHLVKVALGESARYLEETEGPPIHVRVESEQPIGVGFGSSAAVAVGVVQAYLAIRGRKLDGEALHRLALEVERRQHGRPSGIDPATVRRGGGLWARQGTDGLQFESVALRAPMIEQIQVVDTGTPAESTGEVVSAVRERRDADPAWFQTLLDRMEALTHRMRTCLLGEAHRPDELLETVRAYEACLEELRVVPEAVRARIRAVEARGGAAKISGAGALTGSGAGALIVYHPDPRVPLGEVLEGCPRYDVRLGVEGAHQKGAA